MTASALSASTRYHKVTRTVYMSEAYCPDCERLLGLFQNLLTRGGVATVLLPCPCGSVVRVMLRHYDEGANDAA